MCAHTHACAHTHTHAHMHARTHARTHTHIHTHARTHARTHAHTHTHTHTHTHMGAQQSKSNEMLSGLRYFEHALKDNGRGRPKPAFSWGAVDMGSVARCFLQLCKQAIDVFSSEPRLLAISSPVYVLGEPAACVCIHHVHVLYVYVVCKAYV